MRKIEEKIIKAMRGCLDGKSPRVFTPCQKGAVLSSQAMRLNTSCGIQIYSRPPSVQTAPGLSSQIMAMTHIQPTLG